MKSRKTEPRTRLMTVLLLGPPQVGKTKLVEKLNTGKYNDDYTETADLCSFTIDGLEGAYYRKTNLQLWDVPGKSDLPPENVGFAIICCEKTNANPKADLERYTGMARKYNPSLPIFVLQTKADPGTEPMAAKGIAEFIAATENCYDLGEISAKKDFSFEIKNLFQKATHIFDRASEENLKKFFEKRAEIANAGWKPKLFTRSNITHESSWEELILDARHKKTSNANKAFLALGWLDENGDLTEGAPKAMITANKAIIKHGMQFKPLK
ncbi:MAG TPA: hypothetical protein VFU82_00655 [Gammaproteobacteria bacterium]|nr:hypothetical protein [Gammaproteobacteria bacterium]